MIISVALHNGQSHLIDQASVICILIPGYENSLK
jgi:hypothetical protein